MGSLRFGEAQLPDWDSLAFVAVPAQAGDGDPGDACVRQVLLEDVIVKRRCDRQNGRERGWGVVYQVSEVAELMVSPDRRVEGRGLYSAMKAVNSSWSCRARRSGWVVRSCR